MPSQTGTLLQFQEYIWESLPLRKHMAGKEAVFDAVAVAVQEWPDEVLALTKSGDTGEIVASKELIESIRRHMTLTYGEARFGSLWVIALQVLLPVIVDQMLKWWRRRKENRGRLRLWRRKWVNGEG